MKTQELYFLVFATRYLDIFTDYISLYNTVMKLIFLGSSFSIVWYMRHHKIVRRSYDKDQDTFRHFFLVLPCLILALLIHEKFTFKEVFYFFCNMTFYMVPIERPFINSKAAIMTGTLDFLAIFGSCRHTTSAGAAAKNTEH